MLDCQQYGLPTIDIFLRKSKLSLDGQGDFLNSRDTIAEAQAEIRGKLNKKARKHRSHDVEITDQDSACTYSTVLQNRQSGGQQMQTWTLLEQAQGD